LRAVARIALGNTREGIEDLAKVESIGADAYASSYARALQLMFAEDYEIELEALQPIFADPRSGREWLIGAYIARSMSYPAKGEEKLALDDLKAVMNIAPDF